MGRINIEVPDDLHDNLRDESEESGLPIKYLVIESLQRRYGS